MVCWLTMHTWYVEFNDAGLPFGITYNPSFLFYIDRNDFLGGIFTHPWSSQSCGYIPCSYQQSLLPDAVARLADSLLGIGR